MLTRFSLVNLLLDFYSFKRFSKVCCSNKYFADFFLGIILRMFSLRAFSRIFAKLFLEGFSLKYGYAELFIIQYAAFLSERACADFFSNITSRIFFRIFFRGFSFEYYFTDFLESNKSFNMLLFLIFSLKTSCADFTSNLLSPIFFRIFFC